MAAELGDLIARILLDSKEFNAAMKGVEEQSKETSEKASEHMGGLSGAIDGIASAAAGLAIAFKFEELGEAALEAATKTTELEESFRAIAGPTEETEKLLSDLSELEFHSLFDFEDTLGPAAKDMLQLGVSTEQTGKTMKALVDAASGMKKGPEWINQVSEAIGQMSAKMVASEKDVKRLNAMGTDAWHNLAQAIGKEVPEAMEMVKAGTVSSATVIEAVTAGMAKRWAGAGDEMMMTWKGASQLISQTWENLMVSIGKKIADLMVAAKPLVDKATEAINALTKGWAALPGPIQDALILLPTLAVAVIAASTAFTGLAAAFALISFNPVVLGITAVVGVLVVLGKWAYDNWPAIKAVFGEGVDYLAKVFSPLVTFWKMEWAIITSVLTAAWTLIKKGIDVFMSGVNEVFRWIGVAIKAMPVGDEIKKLGELWSTEQGKMAASKTAIEEKKKAQEAANATDAKALALAKQAEAADLARANAAKKFAEERKKSDAELVKFAKNYETASTGFNASVKKNEADFLKAYAKMSNAAVETVEITVSMWDRMPPAIAESIKRVFEAEFALKKLGVTSTVVLKQQVTDAEAWADKVRIAYEHGQASASDYGEALAKVQEAQKRLKEYTERDLTNALKTLGVTTGAQLREAAEKAAAAYDVLAASGAPEDLYDAWQKVLAAQQAVADHANKELTDAFHQLGMKSAQELDDYADKTVEAYEKVAGTVVRGTEVELRARIKALEAIKDARIGDGKDWSKEDEKQLEDAQKRLEEATKKKKNVWAEYFKYIGDVARAFKNDVLDAVWDRMFGPDQNAGLKKQEAELVASLAERASEWDAYVTDNAAQMETLAANYEAAMAGLAGETADALAEAAAAYEEYAADVVQNIEDIREKHATAAAEEIESARDALAEKQRDYEEYAADVARNIEDIQKKYDEQLADDTEKLRDALRDRTQSYEDFVADANKSLQRLGQDTATNISDETEDTQANIAERQRDYNRYAEDTAKKIAEVRTKNKGVYSSEEADLETSLKRKGEDLQTYVAEQNEKLERYVRDQKLRQEREEKDLSDSLDRKTRDFDEYLIENAKDQDGAVKHYEEGLEKEIGKQNESLGKKARDLEEATIETAKQIDAITLKHATAQDAEIKKQQESLAQKKLDYDQHVLDIGTKSDEQAAKIKANYEQGTLDLQTELGKQRAEYDQFVKDITGPDGKLAQLKSQHTSIWTDIGALATGALNDIGKSLLHLASDEVIGVLTGKTKGLKGIWDDIKSAVDAVGESSKTVASNLPSAGGGGSSLPGGGGGGAPSIPGGGGGGAEGIMGFLSGGLLGNILSAGQLVSSVILNFQIAKLETTMNAVEHNTRYAMMYLGEQSDGGIYRASLKIFEELAYGTLVKAMEKHRDQFYDWTGLVQPIFETIRNNVMDGYAVWVDIRTHLADIRTMTGDLLTEARGAGETLRQINVSITAQGITTAEAARALGDQIAANLSKQMVPVT